MSVLQKYLKSSIIEGSKARQVCGMKDQITLTDVEYGNRKKMTKREEFLNKMEEIIPWKAWESMGRNDQTVLSEGRAWATCPTKGQRTPYMTATPCVVFLA